IGCRVEDHVGLCITEGSTARIDERQSWSRRRISQADRKAHSKADRTGGRLGVPPPRGQTGETSPSAFRKARRRAKYRSRPRTHPIRSRRDDRRLSPCGESCTAVVRRPWSHRGTRAYHSASRSGGSAKTEPNLNRQCRSPSLSTVASVRQTAKRG